MADWVFASSALVLLVLLLRAVLKKHLDPRLRYALWLLVLLRLLVPAFPFASPLSLASLVEGRSARIAAPAARTEAEAAPVLPAAPTAEGPDLSLSPAQAGAAGAAAPAAAPVPARQSPLPGPALLRGLWLAGAAVLLLTAGLVNLRFRFRLRRGARPLPGQWTAPPKRVYISAAPGTPCLFGLFAPAIYVPEDLAGNRQALRHVLAHERAHYRHGDSLWAPLRLLALALHWYNPLVWIACALSRQDSELAADASAVSGLEESARLDYGELLLSLADRRHRTGPFLSGTAMPASGRPLKERLSFLVRRPKTAVLTLAALLLCATAAVACTYAGPAREEAPPAVTPEVLSTPEVSAVPETAASEAAPAAGVLDLSGLTRSQVAAKAEELAATAGPCTVDLGSQETGELLWEDVRLLMDAAPQLDFLYRFRLYGLELSTQDETLDLRQASVEDGGAALRDVLPVLRRCRLLDMDGCGVSDGDMAALQADFPDIRMVWRIHLGENYSVRTDTERIVASLTSQGGALDGGQLWLLCYCTDVKYLDLGHNEAVTDLSFVRSMPELEVLLLGHDSVSDLTPLAGCGKLEYLELNNTAVSDLTPLAGLTELRHLNLAACPQVTDLSPLYALTGLERLWLGSQDPVPRAQVEQMQAAAPGCEINTRAESPFAGGWRYTNEADGPEDFGPEGFVTLEPHPRYALLCQQLGYDWAPGGPADGGEQTD